MWGLQGLQGWDKMKLKNCPNCGTLLIRTSKDEVFCPNCGIIQEEELKEWDYKEISKYIG